MQKVTMAVADDLGASKAKPENTNI